MTWIIHRSHQAGMRDGEESVLIETLMWCSLENLQKTSGSQAHPSGSALDSLQQLSIRVVWHHLSRRLNSVMFIMKENGVPFEGHRILFINIRRIYKTVVPTLTLIHSGWIQRHYKMTLKWLMCQVDLQPQKACRQDNDIVLLGRRFDFCCSNLLILKLTIVFFFY